MTANPVLVEVTRSAWVESRHRGAFAVANADGAVPCTGGDIGAQVFPRSALKPLQALSLIETGAAKNFGLVEREVALACSSHVHAAR